MWTKVLWAPSPHQADGQLSGVVRASVSVRGTLVGGFFGWLSMSNRRLLFGNAEWLFSRGKEKGKPFEPIAVISMISPTEPWTFADLIRNILNQKQIYYQEWCQKMLLTHNKGFFFSREVFPFTQALSSLRCFQVQLFRREATQQSAFTATSVSLFLLPLILGILSLLLFDRAVGDHDRRGDGGRHAANVSSLAFMLAIFLLF